MAKSPDQSSPAAFPLRGWFADTHPGFRQAIFAMARPKSYAAGHVIYKAGDAGREFFGVRSGVVTMQGRFTHPDAVMLHMLRAGDWFGTAPVLAGRSRRATAVARTDVELLLVPGGELQALLRHHPEWIVDLARDVVYFLDVALQGSADLLIRDAAARCAAVLLRLAGRRWASEPDADLPAEIPVSQSDLAMLCNLSRSTVSRVVKELAGHRLVTLGYKSLTVIDPTRLRAVADGGGL
ncbi:MAG TPA: Crp/Fnr family transcriptional regulator [Gammaproteobacteria bacterium]|nr:Crp/Fnr family transcriptional regulator [Gammaproteobacteria bacterium]HRP88000.1 Crp/Fnr family transcriptional regulator [Gammaproteobacteria bacterium]